MVFIENNRTIINQYLVEINKKYSIPVACIVFVFIGVPLGIIARRGTFGVAATLSIGFFLLYWASLIGGEKLADRGIIPPWIGMWIADIVLGIIGIYLTIRLARETPTVNWSALKRFIPKFLHTPSMTDSDTE
jgi:lipopolysaccharide export system permease protein